MTSLFNVVVWAAGLCALWCLWDFAIKSFFLDLLREQLFEIRSRLFRLGMDEKLRFDNDVYRQIETLLCGLLRFAHRVSFLTYVFSWSELEKEKKEKDYVDVSKQIALKVSRLPADVQRDVMTILDDTRKALFVYMAFTSLIFLIPFAVIMTMKLFGIWRPERVKATTNVIEWEAYRAEMKRPPARLAAA
jgi:hypothetical protein